jgi:hypothetical protein
MPIRQLARIGLGIIDELSQRASRHCRVDCEGEGRNHHVRNRIEVLQRIVERTALEDRLGDMGARAAQEDGVAIRAGAGDRGSAERTASSPLVFNDHGAKHRLHLLRPRAPDGVVSAARRERNHEPDRTVRIFGLSERGRQRQRPRRQRGDAEGE